ncbi:MAG: OmpH family outer membrane protein [Fidelibacterota bacterium]
MKSISKFALLISLFLMFGIVSTAYPQLKIAYIDSDRILKEFEESKVAQEKLDTEAKKLEQEYSEMITQLDSLRAEYERQRFIMSEERRTEKEREIQDLANRIREFQLTKIGPEGEIYKRQRELVEPILKKINAAINKIGEEGDYDYIFDAVAGNILFAKSGYDITDKVLEELKKGVGE